MKIKKTLKKDAKAKEQNKKDEPKAEPKAVSSADNDFKAAVTAAANEMESKKSFAKRNEGFIIHVNATLKQLQQTRNNLSGINRKQRDAWEKFQKLNADANQLKAEVSNTRAQISRFVSGNYKNSQPNAVALFLKKRRCRSKNPLPALHALYQQRQRPNHERLGKTTKRAGGARAKNQQ